MKIHPLLHIAFISAFLLSPAPGQAPAEKPQTKPVLDPKSATVLLEFEAVSVKTLIHLYQELTGRRMVLDNSVQGQIDLEIPKPVSREDAAELIEEALFINGFFLILKDNNKGIVLGPGKPTRSAAIPIYMEEKELPKGNSIVSYLFKLKHMDTTKLAGILNQYLSTGQPYTCFLPMDRQLLVTESAQTIRNLIPLIQSWDVPSENASTPPKTEAP